ncbi:hypothetical protein B0H11DRAFT_2292418 [Mycena galericulata]|nr:hypothetical protein B0H11DRAFT_2292418 [Mycena galericulata]
MPCPLYSLRILNNVSPHRRTNHRESSYLRLPSSHPFAARKSNRKRLLRYIQCRLGRYPALPHDTVHTPRQTRIGIFVAQPTRDAPLGTYRVPRQALLAVPYSLSRSSFLNEPSFTRASFALACVLSRHARSSMRIHVFDASFGVLIDVGASRPARCDDILVPSFRSPASIRRPFSPHGQDGLRVFLACAYTSRPATACLPHLHLGTCVATSPRPTSVLRYPPSGGLAPGPAPARFCVVHSPHACKCAALRRHAAA